MARHREIDLDPTLDTLDAPEAPVLRRAAVEPSGDTPDSATAINPALDDVRADLGGGVLAPVEPQPPTTVIHGTAGNDFIYGTDGVDIIRGLGGDDFIIAGAGDDRVSGDAGNDMIFGGAGHDQINGNAGDDLLRGNDGNDSLWGADGNDILEGAEGDDRIEGGAGLDALFGGAGNDQMKGGDYADTLDGGDGSDTLEGGKGRDILTGGEGRDFFVADLNGDVWNTHHYRPDVVTDFNPFGWPRDCVDLRLIMDKTTFTGTTVQQAADQGYLSLYEYQNGDGTFGTYVMVDRTGHAPDPHGQGALAMFDLQGVHANELGFSSFASHFLV